MNTTFALDYTLKDWTNWAAQSGYPKFVGKQIYSWIFQKEVLNPLHFSNLSKGVREKLQESFSFDLPQIDSALPSSDGSCKYLLKMGDDLVEMVVMPYENRVTLCLSSQVGCKMGCTFCQTGKMGFTRNLSSGEILSQVLLANSLLEGKKVSNVVFMGMGEPLDNFEAVVEACRIMTDEAGLSLARSRVTVSTSGLVPAINRLAMELPVRLAISLHSTDDVKRSQMMPVNRKYPLDVLKEALMAYPAPKREGITFEYVLIEGKNDDLKDAKKLVKFLHGLKAKVNLIPINKFPGVEMEPSSEARIRDFQKYLADRSIPAPVRYSRGQDVSGGCGQLAAKRKDEVNLDPRILRRKRRVSRSPKAPA